jgi:ADP-ribose pyrophosphatase YjhB (NUDIX family)
VFGLVTLLRIIKRNETTDGYKRDMDSIRQLFKDRFDPDHILLGYQPFRPKASTVSGGATERETAIDIRKLGGLTHTVSAINSLLFGGLVSAVAFPAAALTKNNMDGQLMGLGWAYGLAFLSFILACSLQLVWVDAHEKQTRKKREAGKITHAGGLVYKLENGRVNYLLVGPKADKPNEWLLPKGHIENSEEHGDAALREVQEETGVAAMNALWRALDDPKIKDHHGPVVKTTRLAAIESRKGRLSSSVAPKRSGPSGPGAGTCFRVSARGGNPTTFVDRAANG